jgi:hypothetical protein
VSVGNKKSQGALIVLGPGDSECGPDNRHRGADQWLYVQQGDPSAHPKLDFNPLAHLVALHESARGTSRTLRTRAQLGCFVR